MMKYRGGLINEIPYFNLGLSRNKESIPKQAKELVQYLCFTNQNSLIRNTNNIYGSFNYRLQPFPGDIDSTNILEYDLDDEQAGKEIEKQIKILVNKLVNNKRGRRFADCKCGAYPNGESIHWKPEEILKGIRKANIPDINGQFFNKDITLYDSILDKGQVFKLDMVSPYMGRYVEVSCLYQILTKEGELTKTHQAHDTANFLLELVKDTAKQLKKGKIFKVIKRMYSNAKMREDIKMLRFLEPIINSNLSRLSSIKADFATLNLLLSNGYFPTRNTLNQELQKIKFGLDNVLDMKLNLPKIYKQINNLYIELTKKNKEESVNLLSQLEKELDNKVNEETIKYLRSKGINDFNQFGSNYI